MKLNLELYRLVIAVGVVIKNRTQRKFFSRDIYYAFAIPRVQMHENTRAIHIPPARDFKFCAIQIHFERGQAVIYVCRACSSRPLA